MLRHARRSAKWKSTQAACYAANLADLGISSRAPSRALNGLIARISGYSSRTEPSWSLETAELVFPLVLNLDQPWDIGLGLEGGTNRNMSFTAGLFVGPVVVSCDAGAKRLQVDLTPLGAARLIGGAAANLAAQVVDLSAVDRFDGELAAIYERPHDLPDWRTRFDLVE